MSHDKDRPNEAIPKVQLQPGYTVDSCDDEMAGHLARAQRTSDATQCIESDTTLRRCATPRCPVHDPEEPAPAGHWETRIPDGAVIATAKNTLLGEVGGTYVMVPVVAQRSAEATSPPKLEALDMAEAHLRSYLEDGTSTDVEEALALLATVYEDREKLRRERDALRRAAARCAVDHGRERATPPAHDAPTRVPKNPQDPPFDDGPPCPMCPREIRNLAAVAHNTVSAWRTGRDHKMAERLAELESAVEAARPYSDAHFADRMHSHGEKNR